MVIFKQASSAHTFAAYPKHDDNEPLVLCGQISPPSSLENMPIIRSFRLLLRLDLPSTFYPDTWCFFTPDFVDFNLGVPPVCPFAMTSLPNFHLPKQNRADRGTNKIKVKETSKPPWSYCNKMGMEVLEGLRVSQNKQRPLSRKINKRINSHPVTSFRLHVALQQKCLFGQKV